MTDSYEIIARKYRPRTFEEMVGQKAVVQTLKNESGSGLCRSSP